MPGTTDAASTAKRDALIPPADRWILGCASVVILTLWLLVFCAPWVMLRIAALEVPPEQFQRTRDYLQELGAFGDTFGGLGVLFSGLGLLGVAYALRLQVREASRLEGERVAREAAVAQDREERARLQSEEAERQRKSEQKQNYLNAISALRQGYTALYSLNSSANEAHWAEADDDKGATDRNPRSKRWTIKGRMELYGRILEEIVRDIDERGDFDLPPQDTPGESQIDQPNDPTM